MGQSDPAVHILDYYPGILVEGLIKIMKSGIQTKYLTCSHYSSSIYGKIF